MDRQRGAPSIDQARKALRDLFGHADFREGQEAVVEAALRGRDVLSIMPTGAGKSLCYQLPAMLLDGCTLVISPLLALMKDQLDSLPEAVYERTTVLNSLVERDELRAREDGLAAGRYKLVYAAPERLRQQPFVHALRRARISLVVVDEAHCVSLWGHDFRPDYLFVRRLLTLLGEPRVLAMTATATPAIQAELRERFGRPLETLTTGVLRPNLRLEVLSLPDREAKMRALIDLCRTERGSGIVYVTSRSQAEQLADLLSKRGIRAAHYHAGLSRGERDAAQNAYMLDRTRVMVATVAFGMGVDKANVRFVVHFNPPRSLEAYAQESGRAGRDRLPARCILLETRADRTNLRRWAREETLNVELLRKVYAAVRRFGTDGYTLTTADRLLRAIGADENTVGETELRAAISILERVGLLRRHVDTPRQLSLELCSDRSVPSQSGPELGRLVETAGLHLGRMVSIETVRTAVRADIAPETLEALALEWQEAGLVGVHATGREMLIQILPAGNDAAARVDGALGDWRRAQEQRLDNLMAYLDTTACRHWTIARHFGVPAATRCDMCDTCTTPRAARPDSPPDSSRAVTNVDPGDLVLECLRDLPFRVGRKKLALILRGSIQSPIGPDRCPRFGSLAHLSIGKIEGQIDRLIETGYLGRDEGEYPTLHVTAEGMTKPTAAPPAIAARRTSDAESPSVRVVGESAPAYHDEGADDDGAVFERLRAWRRMRAEADGIAPFMVLSDATLRAVTQARPANTAALSQIQGIGPAKIERYGHAVLQILARERANA